MAELIDKGALVGFVEKKFDMKCTTEHGQGYVDAMHDMKDVIIALMPTTTESEIRASIIETLKNSFRWHYESARKNGIEDSINWADYFDLVAEQLKGE